MRLILVRHGIAVDREAADCPPDPQRPLTPRGVTRLRKAAAGLLALGVKPDVVLTSPYLRAEQTARILSDALAPSKRKLVHTDALLPEADPALLFAELADCGDTEVLCAGHAPHLDRVISLALGVRRQAVTRLGKAGAAHLEISRYMPPRAELIWALTPKALRKLAC